MFWKFRMPGLCLAAAAALALAGCGRGGGGESGGASQFNRVGFSGFGGAAAENRPRQGSVTQSTTVSGAVGGVTQDKVTVSITGGRHSQIVTIANAPDSGSGTGWIISRIGTDQIGSFLTRNGPRQSIGRSAVFYQNNDGSEATTSELEAAQAGLAAIVFSDFLEGSLADTDYLAAGFWLHVPDGANDDGSIDDNEVTVGAFVDSPDKFTQGNLAGLTGSATYTGGAVALGFEGLDAFRTDAARVRLTAEFGDVSALGTISGRVYNLPETNAEVVLGDAPIGDAPGGFFEGRTSIIGEGGRFRDYRGRWGGQFYGDGQNATDHPSRVGGTFGVRDPNGNRFALGVFTGRLQQ